MRMAVVQLEVDPMRRTATFQRALRAIDAAAEQDPAPDLIVLPAYRDVLAVMSGEQGLAERQAGQTVAACGLRARQWGVFVALGFAEQGAATSLTQDCGAGGKAGVSSRPEACATGGFGTGAKPYVTGVLLDADGDLRLAQRQRWFRPAAGKSFAPGDGVTAVDILLGRIAILTGDDLLHSQAWDAAARTGAGMVLGITCWADEPGGRRADAAAIRRQLADHAGRFALACAVADVTTAHGASTVTCPGVSLVVDANGQIVTAAEPAKPTILWWDFDLPRDLPPRSETE